MVTKIRDELAEPLRGQSIGRVRCWTDQVDDPRATAAGDRVELGAKDDIRGRRYAVQFKCVDGV